MSQASIGVAERTRLPGTMSGASILGHRAKAWSILVFWISALVSVTSGQFCTPVYTRLGDSSSRDNASCGLNASQPCLTIKQSIANAAPLSEGCTEVQLLPSAYDGVIPCEVLHTISNVSIDGSDAGRIPLRLANCSNTRDGTESNWLFFFNSASLHIHDLDVHLANFSGASAIKLLYSAIVNITNSQFAYPMFNTSSIISLDTTALRVSDCEFFGEHIQDPFSRPTYFDLPVYRLAVIVFNHTCRHDFDCLANATASNGRGTDLCCPLPRYSELPVVSALNGHDMLLERLWFRNLGLRPSYGRYSDTNRYQDASAVHVAVVVSFNFRSYVENCTFSNMSSPYDTVLKLFAGRHAKNVLFSITGSHFENGRAKFGGAIRMRVFPSAENTSIHVTDSTFTNNTSSKEGGAISISYGRYHGYQDDVNETSVFATIQNCQFERNVASSLSGNSVGGAISVISTDVLIAIQNYTQFLPTVLIRNSRFQLNSADVGSAMFVSGIQLLLAGSLVDGQTTGSPLVVSSTLLILGNNVTFSRNSVTGMGGAMRLSDHSTLTFAKNAEVNFINNSATYAGGAIFADIPSSTLDNAELLQFESNVGLTKPCFIQSSPGNVYSLSSSPANNSLIYFHGNTAAYGNSFFANSYIPCLDEKNSFLQSLKHTPHSDEIQQEVASGPVWLLFSSAGTDCLKPNPQNVSQYWLYHRKCDRNTIFNDSQNASTFIDRGYTATLNDFVVDIRQFFKKKRDTSGFRSFPRPPDLVVPWAVTTYQWFYPRASGESYESAATRLSPDLLASTYISEVILYPAPGELFELKIEAADIYLNKGVGYYFIKVHTGDVLLIQGGYVQARKDVVFGLASESVVIGIAGRPGASGFLQISGDGQLTDSRMNLLLPFRLKPCHVGYTETSFMGKADEVIRQFVLSFQRSRLADSYDRNAPSNQLRCQCPSPAQYAGVLGCANGSDIRMHWEYWAGVERNEDALSAVASLKYITDIQEYETDEKFKVLLTSPCYSGFCSDHNQSAWYVREESPCPSNRQGLICGSCATGYSVSVAVNPTCVKCSSSDMLLGRLGVLFIIMQTGLELFFFSFFEIGTSAIFDSWVNFEQFCLFLTRREIAFWTFYNYNYLNCLSSGSNIMEMTAGVYLVSLCFFAWLIVIWQLSRLVIVKRFIMYHSLIPGIWAVIIFSYVYLLLPSFNLLACHQFNRRIVLFFDASITCFGPAHLPWGLLAICALALVAIPLPIVLVAKKQSPKIKPLLDVYLSYVEDGKHWFIAFSLVRRIVVCALSVFIPATLTRQLVLAVVMQLYLVLHFVIRPYRRRTDNIWETVFLGAGCLYALLNVIPLSEHVALQKVLRAVYVIPTASALVWSAYHNWSRLLDLIEYILTFLLLPMLYLYYRLQQKPFQRIFFKIGRRHRGTSGVRFVSPEAKVERAKEQYNLRDSLLADVFQDKTVNSTS